MITEHLLSTCSIYNGQSYDDYLKELAQAAGIEDPTREQLARLDRKRTKKGSDQEWMSPSDPDARITKAGRRRAISLFEYFNIAHYSEIFRPDKNCLSCHGLRTEGPETSAPAMNRVQHW